jgi:hypothetical protein
MLIHPIALFALEGCCEQSISEGGYLLISRTTVINTLRQCATELVKIFHWLRRFIVICSRVLFF